jgi:putative hydrolase of the HAD superfamily
MIIVFDLDDTLYKEEDFVNSGFRSISIYLEQMYDIPSNKCFSFLIRRLSQGRGTIFDDLLKQFGIYSRKRVSECVSVYRKHKPDIILNPEAESCLKALEAFPKYIVTDGNKLVQKNKIIALGLENRVKSIFITHRYGLKHSKPSPYCFYRICELEKVTPDQVLYVGDNPNKDFVGIKPFGFKTIRVLQGAYQYLQKEKDFEAEVQIDSLAGLTPDFINSVF